MTKTTNFVLTTILGSFPNLESVHMSYEVRLLKVWSAKQGQWSVWTHTTRSINYVFSGSRGGFIRVLK